MATGADERLRRVAMLGTYGHAGEIDAVEDVRVHEFGRKVERDHIELGCRPVGIDREQGQSPCPHERFEVEPGCVGALGDHVGPLVEDLVEDLEALVGQADLVCIGVRQEPGDLARAVFRSQRSQLTADVRAGFCTLAKSGSSRGHSDVMTSR